MNSTTICELQIKDNVIQKTECRESHLFRPLSSEEGGARTEVTSSVSLVSTTNAGAAAKLSSKTIHLTDFEILWCLLTSIFCDRQPRFQHIDFGSPWCSG
jgi:hypothetical protein